MDEELYNTLHYGSNDFIIGLIIEFIIAALLFLSIITLAINIIIIRRRIKKFDRQIIEQLKETNEHLRNIEEYQKIQNIKNDSL